MGMFNFVLDSIKWELFDFKVKRRVYVASTVDVVQFREKFSFRKKVLLPNILLQPIVYS